MAVGRTSLEIYDHKWWGVEQHNCVFPLAVLLFTMTISFTDRPCGTSGWSGEAQNGTTGKTHQLECWLVLSQVEKLLGGGGNGRGEVPEDKKWQTDISTTTIHQLHWLQSKYMYEMFIESYKLHFNVERLNWFICFRFQLVEKSYTIPSMRSYPLSISQSLTLCYPSLPYDAVSSRVHWRDNAMVYL